MNPDRSSSRSPAAFHAAGILLLLVWVTGCVRDTTTLNSERIARKFGSYNVEVIENNNNIRVSNLYSLAASGAVCRTLAIVQSAATVEPEFALEQRLIGGGASIGQVFRSHGWDIRKRHLYVGNIEIDALSSRIARLMQIETPASLAVHVYVFAIAKDGRAFDYATIAEVHHPGYLTAADLRKIYGGRYSGARRRDAAAGMLALVKDRFRDAPP